MSRAVAAARRIFKAFETGDVAGAAESVTHHAVRGDLALHRQLGLCGPRS